LPFQRKVLTMKWERLVLVMIFGVMATAQEDGRGPCDDIPACVPGNIEE